MNVVGVERHDPDWAPDGSAIIYAVVQMQGDAYSGIHIYDLRTRVDTRLPESNGYWRPRWSPDGRHVAVLTRDLQRLLIFDLDRRQWRQVAQGRSLIAACNHDGSRLYCQDLLEHYQPTYRLQPGAGHVERVMDFAFFLDEGVSRCALAGVSPDDSLIIMIDRSTSNLYALELNTP